MGLWMSNIERPVRSESIERFTDASLFFHMLLARFVQTKKNTVLFFNVLEKEHFSAVVMDRPLGITRTHK